MCNLPFFSAVSLSNKIHVSFIYSNPSIHFLFVFYLPSYIAFKFVDDGKEEIHNRVLNLECLLCQSLDSSSIFKSQHNIFHKRKLLASYT